MQVKHAPFLPSALQIQLNDASSSTTLKQAEEQRGLLLDTHYAEIVEASRPELLQELRNLAQQTVQSLLSEHAVEADGQVRTGSVPTAFGGLNAEGAEAADDLGQADHSTVADVSAEIEGLAAELAGGPQANAGEEDWWQPGAAGPEHPDNDNEEFGRDEPVCNDPYGARLGITDHRGEVLTCTESVHRHEPDVHTCRSCFDATLRTMEPRLREVYDHGIWAVECAVCLGQEYPTLNAVCKCKSRRCCACLIDRMQTILEGYEMDKPWIDQQKCPGCKGKLEDCDEQYLVCVGCKGFRNDDPWILEEIRLNREQPTVPV